ncbi:MAG: 30S ribosomal protein S6 [Acidimicrobiales bacterium]|nr:30S ribosomal protein S6 [Acidimicrobiales bacterium]
MRAYELMIIIDRDAADTGVAPVLDLVEAGAKTSGGEVRSTDRWGMRQFAYEINHKTEGYYVVLEIVTPASGLEDLERQLRIADDVVRHKLIRLPDAEAARRGLLEAAAG